MLLIFTNDHFIIFDDVSIFSHVVCIFSEKNTSSRNTSSTTLFDKVQQYIWSTLFNRIWDR